MLSRFGLNKSKQSSVQALFASQLMTMGLLGDVNLNINYDRALSLSPSSGAGGAGVGASGFDYGAAK